MDHIAKMKLAKEAGNGIMKESFEADMHVLKAAFDFVWEKSY